jgi:PAS domain-containing protein
MPEVRLVLDAIPALAWSAGPAGSADFFNQRWLDYTGLSPEQALASGWKLAIHPNDLPGVMEAFQEAVRRTQPLEVAGVLMGTIVGLFPAEIPCATKAEASSGTKNTYMEGGKRA